MASEGTWRGSGWADSTRILMLHRVLPNASTAFGLPGCYRLRGTALTVEELVRLTETQSPFLPLAAVEEAMERGEAPPPGTVLTFDDGYREHLDVVSPLLSERKISATFYVATGLHGDGTRVAAVDAWYWLLDHAIESEASVPLPDGSLYRERVDTLESKLGWIGGPPKQALLSAASRVQAQMLSALADSLGVALPADLAARLYLRPTEWCELKRLGMRVGAHSVSHPRLTQVDALALCKEVEESVGRIREVDAPVAFAYPDGAYDHAVVDAVGRSRVSSAVTCEPGVTDSSSDVLRLPRIFARPGWVASL